MNGGTSGADIGEGSNNPPVNTLVEPQQIQQLCRADDDPRRNATLGYWKKITILLNRQ
jgi:hypothetical protein